MAHLLAPSPPAPRSSAELRHLFASTVATSRVRGATNLRLKPRLYCNCSLHNSSATSPHLRHFRNATALRHLSAAAVFPVQSHCGRRLERFRAHIVFKTVVADSSSAAFSVGFLYILSQLNSTHAYEYFAKSSRLAVRPAGSHALEKEHKRLRTLLPGLGLSTVSEETRSADIGVC